jgi:transcriptional regulator with XRE-family HTH domain
MAHVPLASILKKKGLSKRQFAKRLNVRYENVFRFFRPSYDPKLSMLTRWAKAIGCKVRDLIKE